MTGFQFDHNGVFNEQVQPVADVERQVVVMERHADLLPHPERTPAEIIYDAGFVGALQHC